jgi:hypothetical protein
MARRLRGLCLAGSIFTPAVAAYAAPASFSCADLRNKAEKLRNGARNCDAAVAQGLMSSCEVNVTFSLEGIPVNSDAEAATPPWTTSPSAARALAAEVDALRCVKNLKVDVSPPGPYKPGDSFTIVATVELDNGASPAGIPISFKISNPKAFVLNPHSNGEKIAKKASLKELPDMTDWVTGQTGIDGVARIPALRALVGADDAAVALETAVIMARILQAGRALVISYMAYQAMTSVEGGGCRAPIDFAITPARGFTRTRSLGGAPIDYVAQAVYSDIPANAPPCRINPVWNLTEPTLGDLSPTAGQTTTFTPADIAGNSKVRASDEFTGVTSKTLADAAVAGCSDEDRNRLNQDVTKECKSAKVGCPKSQTGANTFNCVELRDFADQTRRCIAGRSAVIAACYSQRPDPAHLQDISNLKNITLERCLSQIMNYGGATPCP